MSLSLPAHNRSILFLMECTAKVWQIDLRRTACPEIEGKTHRSKPGCVRVGEVGYFRTPLLLCCPVLLTIPMSLHISKKLSPGGLADIPGMDAGTIS